MEAQNCETRKKSVFNTKVNARVRSNDDKDDGSTQASQTDAVLKQKESWTKRQEMNCVALPGHGSAVRLGQVTEHFLAPILSSIQ